MLICLLIVIPASFAVDNDDMTLTDLVDVNSTDDYYFDINSDIDGNGSSENPYKNFTSDRMMDNSRIHLASGEYNLTENGQFNNISFYGQSAQSTVLNGNGYTLNCDLNLVLHNITLKNLRIITGYEFTLNASNVIFKDVNANRGVIYSPSKGTIILENCSFLNNAINDYGIIYLYRGNIKLFNSTFANNSAKNGVIYKNSGSIEIYSSTFENNSADNGGVIYSDSALVDIYNSTFADNSATSGGALYIRDNSINICNSSFRNNSADFGGAIYVESGGLTINNSNFENNMASYFGGSITSISSDLNLTNNTFYDNRAGLEGGAVYSMYGNYYLHFSKFFNNSAMIGGALFVDANNNTTIKNNQFENNSAVLLGRAIYSLANANSTIEDNDYINDDLIETSIPTLFPNDNNVTIYIYNSSFTGELPSYYSLRDEGYVTPVKNQLNGGNCWAFSAIGALESCLLKASGISFDLSEDNMKNLMALYSDYGWNRVTNTGGFDDMAVGYLISWLGPVKESDDKYEDHSILSPILSSFMHIQNVLYLTRDNYTDNDDIKKAILEFGGVSTSIRWTGSSVKGNARYYDGSDNADHAVVIVGWDDNYSRTNFAKTPKGDGAWIIKNSWGTGSGDGGYWYVSYYDTKLAQPGRNDITYTFILNDTVKFDKNYQYDVPGKSDFLFNTTDTVWYKNIFNATDNEYLAAVSTFFYTDTEWDLSIYVNNALELTQSGFSKSGYWTINLDEFIPLDIGDIFEIVFKITVDQDVGVPISEKISFNKYFYHENISFISYDGENWIELFDLNGTYPNHKYNSQVVCIKAFTVFDMINTTTELILVNESTISIQAKVLNQYNRPVNAGSVTFTFDNNDYIVKVHDGVAVLNLYVVPGNYNVSAVFNGAGHISSKDNLSVDVPLISTNVVLNVLNDYNPVMIIANVTNQFGYPVNMSNVTFTLDGIDFIVDVVNGIAMLNHNFTNLGFNSIFAEFNENYYFASSNATSNVTVKSTIISSNETKTYASAYSVILLDNYGNALSNTKVTFIIGPETYYRITDGNGVANLDITLNPGSYEVMIINPINNETKNQTINVVKRITENKYLIMYYGKGKYYKVKVWDDDGNAAAGVAVTFTINNAEYTRITDSDGYASFKISLKPAKYIITAEYKGFKVSNVVTVKSTIVTKDISLKKGKTIKFTAKLLNKNGKILKNKKVTFKFKGKTYKVKTNSKGKAVLKIFKKYKKGKYTIKTSYGGLQIKNKITIK